jgi:hypothetical protein
MDERAGAARLSPASGAAMEAEDLEIWLTLKSAARLLNRRVDELRQACREGELHGARLLAAGYASPPQKLVQLSEVRAWVARKIAEEPPRPPNQRVHTAELLRLDAKGCTPEGIVLEMQKTLGIEISLGAVNRALQRQRKRAKQNSGKKIVANLAGATPPDARADVAALNTTSPWDAGVKLPSLERLLLAVRKATSASGPSGNR